MKEAAVEEYLRKRVKAIGGLAEKFTVPARRGPPDRQCTYPWGRLDYVETKRPKGGELKPWQERDHARRRAWGFRVYVIYTKDQVDTYIGEVKAEYRPEEHR